MKRLTGSLTLLLALAARPAVAELGATSDARPAALAPAPTDAVRLRPTDAARGRVRDLEAWLAANPTTRAHLSTDRPLYEPGDTVQVKLWALSSQHLAPVTGPRVAVELIDPRGLVAQTAELDLLDGGADGAFRLDPATPGGAWTLRATLPDGRTTERALRVLTFESPRVKKTLTFTRDGYAAGDTFEANVTLSRATGEPLAKRPVTAQLAIDGQPLPVQALQTDARGEVTVRFTLPASLRSPDAQLTVLVDDAGVTESITRAVPVALDAVQVGVFPEGGDLVTGLESRVYVEATDAWGAAVDLHATLVDDRGAEVTSVTTWVDGRGHFRLTPAAGRSYHLRVDGRGEQPPVPLPEARPEGCVLHHFDDLQGAQTAVRVQVACTRAEQITLLATQQDEILDRATVMVRSPTTVWLRSGAPELATAQGIARVTLFDHDQTPIAERLVFRNRSQGLAVSVQPDRAQYKPGDEVALSVRTTDAAGRPISAQLAVSVVDDALLAFADDQGDSLASGLLLQADLPEPIAGAAAWLRPDDADGGLALDLALGTRGWRRFDWSQVDGFVARAAELERQRKDEVMLGYLGYAEDDRAIAGRGDMRERLVMADAAVAQAGAPAMAFAREEQKPSPPATAAAAKASVDEEPRTFAAPLPSAVPTPARSDFRDTVLWKPAVLTGSDGRATVRFRLTDAVTSFRATAEGLGAARVGGGDALIVSQLPFHVEARLPVALSTGDHLDVPITLENTGASSLPVALRGSAGPLVQLGAMPSDLSLAAGERRSVWLGLDVRPGSGVTELRLDATAGALRDGLVRRLPIEPAGVPQRWSTSGRLEGAVSTQLTIPREALPGSATGRVTLLPSPISEVLTGIEQMVRTPGGCFEQTSSTNWPNVVVLDLLDRAGEGARVQIDRKSVLDAGYGILTKYQVPTGGFETWGSGPGKEALTAYGLLEFYDMDRVYDVDPKILAESRQYLLGQRDGKGGYAVTGASAHGYGTAPPEVLDAYITYALVETGASDLAVEIARSAELARRSEDPYRMGLATLTLLRARPADGKAAAARLAALQAADGSFPGSETSITRSENYNLDVEATALAAMALRRAGDLPRARKAVAWLHAHQTAAGQWGATQGNALALRAIGELAASGTQGDAPGALTVRVDGELVHQATVDPGATDPVTFDLGPYLSVGAHTVDLRLDGLSVPYAVEAGWTTTLPDSDPDRRVDLDVDFASTRATLGGTVRATATLTNRTQSVVPDPIARLGLPAGLEADPRQLEAMKRRGEIAFFELRPREVTVYWDGIGVGEVHHVALDLTATAAGRFTAPASSAYPYYDDQAKAWVAGERVEIAAGR